MAFSLDSTWINYKQLSTKEMEGYKGRPLLECVKEIVPTQIISSCMVCLCISGPGYTTTRKYSYDKVSFLVSGNSLVSVRDRHRSIHLTVGRADHVLYSDTTGEASLSFRTESLQIYVNFTLPTRTLHRVAKLSRTGLLLAGPNIPETALNFMPRRVNISTTENTTTSTLKSRRSFLNTTTTEHEDSSPVLHVIDAGTLVAWRDDEFSTSCTNYVSDVFHRDPKNPGTPHTLILRDCPSLIVKLILQKPLPSMRRLVLDSTLERLDLQSLLEVLTTHQKQLLELHVPDQIPSASGALLNLVQSTTFSFHVISPDAPDEAPFIFPPLEVAKDLQGGFPQLPTILDRPNLKDVKGFVALGTGGFLEVDDQVVERCRLFDSLGPLKSSEPVPVSLDPPVASRIWVLAFHFLRHFVLDEVNLKLVEWYDQSPPQQLDEDPEWCVEFERFLSGYITGSPKEKISTLSQLLAVGWYLNCASLKHFCHVALVIMVEPLEG